MPKQKDLKRIVRARMEKTGESYTAARARILDHTTGPSSRKAGEPAARSLPPDARLAELAGMSNEKIRERTGRSWKEWVGELDAIGALSMRHRDIAQRLHDEFGVGDWWSQTVTVGYERIRGLREIGQRLGTGTFDANKSKTFAAPVSRLYRAFAHEATRERWLPGETIRIRTAIRNKSMRITWTDGTSVHAYFLAKGEKKSQLAIQHVGLSDREAVAASKAYWSKRLEALAGVL
jgi:hypothetical protein